jgi:hypothetical protein
MKKVAIVQSNYIPWKGYFDLIAAADEFILYDDAQYTRSDWRNRNKIKTPQGLRWLTVPVTIKGKFPQLIREAEISGNAWQEKHWKNFCQYYGRAPHFKAVAERLAPYYHERRFTHLSDLNRSLTEMICDYLRIDTKITRSSDYALPEGRTQRIVSLCAQAGATEYISGPAARGYIEPELFQAAGIALRWFDYDGYPAYPQQGGAFEHGVSIVDLLFNCGEDARRYMKCGAM